MGSTLSQLLAQALGLWGGAQFPSQGLHWAKGTSAERGKGWLRALSRLEKQAGGGDIGRPPTAEPCHLGGHPFPVLLVPLPCSFAQGPSGRASGPPLASGFQLSLVNEKFWQGAEGGEVSLTGGGWKAPGSELRRLLVSVDPAFIQPLL